MRQTDYQRLQKVTAEIETTLANPLKQSMQFYRGDLRILMKAAKVVMVGHPAHAPAVMQTKRPPPHRSAR